MHKEEQKRTAGRKRREPAGLSTAAVGRQLTDSALSVGRGPTAGRRCSADRQRAVGLPRADSRAVGALRSDRHTYLLYF